MAGRSRPEEWQNRLPSFVHWLDESAQRLEAKRAEALAAGRKRDRDSVPEEGHGGASASSGPPESLPPPSAAGGASSSRVLAEGEPSMREQDMMGGQETPAEEIARLREASVMDAMLLEQVT